MADDYWPWPSPEHRNVVTELWRISQRRKMTHPGVRLDASAFAILLILSDGRPRTLRELTEDLDLEQSTVNRQVNAAIKHGYLERVGVPDCASKLIRPTEHGRREYEHDGALRAQRLTAVLDEISPGTLEGLVRELRAFNDAYDRVLARAATATDAPQALRA
ncbi:MAG TPA: MarR family winged helix-turn-helix transcriptional regulator [Aldersonia sp.]